MKITRELLERFSQDECTDEEQQAIQRWANDNSWPWYASGEQVPDSIREVLWRKLQDSIHSTEQTVSKPYRKMSVLALIAAACAAIILGSVLLIRQTRTSTIYQEVTYQTNSQEHKRIVLSDSSVVFLSPGSSIRLIQPFKTNHRKLTLKGQAVFEAVHDPQRPFSVVSGELITTALGTSFKVTSFPGTHETKVALSYGKLVVKDMDKPGKQDALYLAPGEEAVYDKQTRTIHKSAKPTGEFDFQTNILYFKDAGLQEVVSKLSEYYQIIIHYEALKGVNWSVSGEFDYQPLSTVLKAIAYSCNIHYEIQNHQVILQPNN